MGLFRDNGKDNGSYYLVEPILMQDMLVECRDFRERIGLWWPYIICNDIPKGLMN